jgi:hypothetical protein
MLFDLSELKREPVEQSEVVDHIHGHRVAGDVHFVVGKRGADLAKLIGELHQNEHIYLPSMAAWSMHDILAYVLHQVGPADVWLTTWTITEEPVRLLIALQDQGRMRFRGGLLHDRVPTMNPKAYELAKANLRIQLAKVHAKNLVVITEDWGVTVAGSANWTNNPRIEQYVIGTHRSAAEFQRDWIERCIAGEKPFAQ